MKKKKEKRARNTFCPMRKSFPYNSKTLTASHSVWQEANMSHVSKVPIINSSLDAQQYTVNKTKLFDLLYELALLKLNYDCTLRWCITTNTVEHNLKAQSGCAKTNSWSVCLYFQFLKYLWRKREMCAVCGPSLSMCLCLFCFTAQLLLCDRLGRWLEKKQQVDSPRCQIKQLHTVLSHCIYVHKIISLPPISTFQSKEEQVWPSRLKSPAWGSMLNVQQLCVNILLIYTSEILWFVKPRTLLWDRTQKKQSLNNNGGFLLPVFLKADIMHIWF